MPEPVQLLAEAAAVVADQAVLDLEDLGLDPLEVGSALIAAGLRTIDKGGDPHAVLAGHRFILKHVQGQLGELDGEIQAELARRMN